MRIIFFMLLLSLNSCHNYIENHSSNQKRSKKQDLFVHFPARKEVSHPKWGKLLTDIKQHEVFFDNKLDDLITVGHEATHDISIFFRMNEQKGYQRLINAFYVLENRVAIIENPPIGLSEVYTFIPEELREELFEIYFPNSSYESNPLYIWEEWNAYVNGAAVGIDLFQSGLLDSKQRDTLASMLEFLVYAAALAIAVEEKAPLYYKNNAQFMRFFRWNSQRTMRIYNKGKKLQPFANSMHVKLLEKINTHPKAKKIKSFLTRQIGPKWKGQK